ncbi:MAG TPA: hypothetical protein DD490_02080 [Acidobacteria bacterium]|nr:hypothetical protein [Acidobacteriota bacterium]
MTQQKPLGDDPVMRAILPVGRSGWAIAAGYLGLFALLFVPAPLALLTGIIGIIHIKKNPGLHGMGRCIFAILTGSIGTALLVMFLVLK